MRTSVAGLSSARDPLAYLDGEPVGSCPLDPRSDNPETAGVTRIEFQGCKSVTNAT